MRNIFIILLAIISKVLHSAAPPVDDKPLPPPPYTMSNINEIEVILEWDEDTVKKYIPEKFKNNAKVSGGISIFHSKKKQQFSPLSGAYAWIDFKNSKSEISRLIFFSVYGRNKLLYKIMTKAYSIDASEGSSKVTILNQKVNARTNVGNKNIFTILVNVKESCKSFNRSITLINYKNKNKESLSRIEGKAEKICEADIEKLEIKQPLEQLGIKNIIETNVIYQLEKSYNAPSIRN